MTENAQDIVARAYARLLTLRKNVNQVAEYNIEEKYVRECHSVLDRLEDVGIDISEFRILDSEISPIPVSPRVVSPGKSSHPIHYTKEKYVQKQYVLMKIDSILGYFQIALSEKPRRIGFRNA